MAAPTQLVGGSGRSTLPTTEPDRSEEESCGPARAAPPAGDGLWTGFLQCSRAEPSQASCPALNSLCMPKGLVWLVTSAWKRAGPRRRVASGARPARPP